MHMREIVVGLDLSPSARAALQMGGRTGEQRHGSNSADAAASWLLALDLDCVFGIESFQEVLGEPLHIFPLGVLVVA